MNVFDHQTVALLVLFVIVMSAALRIGRNNTLVSVPSPSRSDRLDWTREKSRRDDREGIELDGEGRDTNHWTAVMQQGVVRKQTLLNAACERARLINQLIPLPEQRQTTGACLPTYLF
jgi:hypothetical protein